MVVGFTTTCAISAHHHKSCEFEPRNFAKCTRYNIVRYNLSVTCHRSVASSINKTDRNDIAEILLKVGLNSISQTKPLIEKRIQTLKYVFLGSFSVIHYCPQSVFLYCNLTTPSEKAPLIHHLVTRSKDLWVWIQGAITSTHYRIFKSRLYYNKLTTKDV